LKAVADAAIADPTLFCRLGSVDATVARLKTDPWNRRMECAIHCASGGARNRCVSCSRCWAPPRRGDG
jgi:hypothetical protein